MTCFSYRNEVCWKNPTIFPRNSWVPQESTNQKLLTEILSNIIKTYKTRPYVSNSILIFDSFLVSHCFININIFIYIKRYNNPAREQGNDKLYLVYQNKQECYLTGYCPLKIKAMMFCIIYLTASIVQSSLAKTCHCVKILQGIFLGKYLCEIFKKPWLKSQTISPNISTEMLWP